MIGLHFSFCGIQFNTNGTFVAIAFIFAGIVFYRECSRLNFSFDQFFYSLLIVVIFAPLGASLLSMIEFSQTIGDVISRNAGSSHFGGLVLTIPALLLVSLRLKI